MLKKTGFLGVLFLLLCNSIFAQLFSFTFNGTGTCPTQGSTLLTQPANVTVSTVTRAGSLTCSPTADYFNTTNWSLGTTMDATQYVEFTVTAATGYKINLTSISFAHLRSTTGPVSGQIATDGGVDNYITTYNNFTIGSSSTTNNWDFPDFSSAISGTVKFRIYGWAAGGTTGTMRLDDITLYATVTTESPITIDYANKRVGIDVSTPLLQKLEVGGNVKATGLIITGSTPAIGKVLTSVDASGTAEWRPAASNWLTLGTSNILYNSDYPKLYIGPYDPTIESQMGSGNVLGVNGTGIFNKIRIRTFGTWPDYVFEPGYNLPTVAEVEKYIAFHKHLPGVQSEKSALKDGLDLAENQAVLLKKIEELTLYIIAQDKKINVLEKQVADLDQLKKRVELLISMPAKK